VICDRTPIKIAQLDVWRRKDCNDARALAISRGGALISDYYVNNNTRLRWRCAQRHEWEATPAQLNAALGAQFAAINDRGEKGRNIQVTK
jgi:hypothetical protein